MAVTRKEKEVQQAELPKGFRFHPTDEELVLHYLCRKEESEPSSIQMIADVDIYKFDPWNLPEKAVHGESEWYFFSPRDRKYPKGSRPNRATGSGFWKATGKDKHIRCVVGGADGSPHKLKKLAVKKTLVFYKGRAPNGAKTNWIMHEYRLSDGARAVSVQSSTIPSRRIHRKGSLRLDDRVLCRIYKKKSTTGGPSMATSYAKFEEVRPDSPVHENAVDSSSVMEDFLASLPEIEKSKLQWFPKLESEFNPNFLNFVDQDFQSTGFVVIDQSPNDDFDDEPSQLDFIDNEENHTLPRTTMMSAIGRPSSYLKHCEVEFR